MAIGGIFAYGCRSSNTIFVRVKNLLFSKYTQYLVIVLTLLLLGMGINFGFFQNEAYSILFAIIICNFALNNYRIMNLEFTWLSYLGKISYGLYMYHAIAIVFVIHVLLKFNVTSNFALYPISIGLTILIAAFSYRFFEKPFIAKKVKFSTLVSGDNAKNT
jgi:peptidoglycan/LPS O-acetylase OafA/YrhL